LKYIELIKVLMWLKIIFSACGEDKLVERIVIAIDGPAGAGKSTISKIIARELNIEYIDTGAMYRAIALKIFESGISPDNIEGIRNILDTTDINFIGGRIFLDNRDVSKEIRTPEISSEASRISAIPMVREKLVHLQRNMASKKSVIMDGRDIGTNVLKDAQFKIFLTASVEERAGRRYKELCNNNMNVTFEGICKDIENRDRNDMEREINPLRRAEDALLVGTTGKSIDDVVNEILKIVNTDRE
jgi:cytidylate kinase